MRIDLQKTAVTVLVMALAAALALGCKKPATSEQTIEQNVAEVGTNVPMPQVPSQVMVPDEIKAKWKAVVIEVTDKDTKEKKEYTVPIGQTAPLGNTGLTITVEAFLPSFTMAGDVFTSASPELNNPAARVKIEDKAGTPTYTRWLFSLYPDTHPYEHSKYAVILKDYVAAK